MKTIIALLILAALSANLIHAEEINNMNCQATDGFNDRVMQPAITTCDNQGVTETFPNYCEGNIIHRHPIGFAEETYDCTLKNAVCMTDKDRGAYCGCIDGADDNGVCIQHENLLPELGLIGGATAVIGTGLGYAMMRKK